MSLFHWLQNCNLILNKHFSVVSILKFNICSGSVVSFHQTGPKLVKVDFFRRVGTKSRNLDFLLQKRQIVSSLNFHIFWTSGSNRGPWPRTPPPPSPAAGLLFEMYPCYINLIQHHRNYQNCTDQINKRWQCYFMLFTLRQSISSLNKLHTSKFR